MANDTDRLRVALQTAWIDFLVANPDDLTSPEDLPHHALMTGRQFVDCALSVLSQPEAAGGGVRVKPLEWEGDGHWCNGDNEGWMEEANTPFGWGYAIEFGRYDEGAFIVDTTFGKRLTGFETPDEAKAAAFADYERRILSALSTPQDTPRVVEKGYNSSQNWLEELNRFWREGEATNDTRRAARVAVNFVREKMKGLSRELASRQKAEGVCPDCGRKKARNAVDAGNGLCPKHWAIRDPYAEKDCDRHAASPSEEALRKEVERLTVERGQWEHQCGVNLEHYNSERTMRLRAEARLREARMLISSTHKNAVKHENCERPHCPICEGGLFQCADCGAAEIETEQRVCTAALKHGGKS